MKTEYQEIISKHTTRWEPSSLLDDKLSEFSRGFEKWFEQIPRESKATVLRLLDNFHYYSHTESVKWLLSLHCNLTTEYLITDEDTIYTYIKSKDGISNSSNDYWTEYKMHNDINRNICYENSNVITDEQWSYINNFIFVDDCSGTGKSFIDELLKKINKYQGKNVYFVSIHIMDEAKEKILAFATDNGINIILINAKVQKKAFSCEYFDTEWESAKQIIIDASKLFGIPERDILGFKESESLMAFYNNTPNNTLGFLRYDTEKYKSIFPRQNDKKPGWQNLRQEREKRKAKNYNTAVRGASDE